MHKLESDVRDDVARLLALLNPGVGKDSEDYQFVLSRLTRMAILGTAPAGCNAPNAPKAPQPDSDSNYSESKMNWIEGRR